MFQVSPCINLGKKACSPHLRCTTASPCIVFDKKYAHPHLRCTPARLMVITLNPCTARQVWGALPPKHRLSCFRVMGVCLHVGNETAIRAASTPITQAHTCHSLYTATLHKFLQTWHWISTNRLQLSKYVHAMHFSPQATLSASAMVSSIYKALSCEQHCSAPASL